MRSLVGMVLSKRYWCQVKYGPTVEPHEIHEDRSVATEGVDCSLQSVLFSFLHKIDLLHLKGKPLDLTLLLLLPLLLPSFGPVWLLNGIFGAVHQPVEEKQHLKVKKSKTKTSIFRTKKEVTLTTTREATASKKSTVVATVEKKISTVRTRATSKTIKITTGPASQRRRRRSRHLSL